MNASHTPTFCLLFLFFFCFVGFPKWLLEVICCSSFLFYLVHSGNTIECCDAEGYNLSPRYIHPLCAPISVPIDDPYYSKHNVECMTYVRSIAAIRSDCSFGPLEQVSILYFLGGRLY